MYDCVSPSATPKPVLQQVTKYDLWDVPIVHVKARTQEPAAEIEVPGLEEKRPSLLKGDRVYVWQLARGDDAAYEGIVWEVRKSSIVALFGCTCTVCSLYTHDCQCRSITRILTVAGTSDSRMTASQSA